jgi:hypothetical protein
MSFAPGARRADTFARLLDAPAATDDAAFAPYLALAGALRAVPAAPGPSPEFRNALRQRLVAVATVQGVGEQQSATQRLRAAGLTWNFQRRVAIVAGGAAAATAIAGVGVGASHSLPGDAFYGLKRATENVQLALTTGQEGRGKRHLEFARTRLHEVQALVGQDSALTAVLPGGVDALGVLPDDAKASTIISTLQDMDSQTRSGAQDLWAVALNDQTSDALTALNTFTRTQFDGLRDVLPELPTAAQPRATQSLSLLALVAKQSADVQRETAGGASTGTGGGSGQSTASPTPTPGETTTPSPVRTGGGSPTPDVTPKQPALPSVPTTVPTTAPTIPPLPLPTTLPTSLPAPSSLPTLPDLGALLPNQP